MTEGLTIRPYQPGDEHAILKTFNSVLNGLKQKVESS